MQQSISFATGAVKYVFQSSLEELSALCGDKRCVVITDKHIASLYPNIAKAYNTLTIPAGEAQKNLTVISALSEHLLEIGADRNTILVGIGGGVITDLTGFLASIYMRGIEFGFVPTTLLAMADASVGGKNGVSIGLYKNILGTIRQPSFILYAPSFLKTLPDREWSNGFAEIIKYACIFDACIFDELSERNIGFYKEHPDELNKLVERCVEWKNKVVAEDEKENGNRKLLNFGHTAGHAIEKLYNIPHGQAVALGMIIACMVSENAAGLDSNTKNKLRTLLQQYGLPVNIKLDVKQLMDILKKDKKRNAGAIDYVVLEHIGKGAMRTLPFDVIERAITTYASPH